MFELRFGGFPNSLLTNFYKPRLSLYMSAIDIDSKRDKEIDYGLYIRYDAFDINGNQVHDCYSLHTTNRCDMSEFWKIFRALEKGELPLFTMLSCNDDDAVEMRSDAWLEVVDLVKTIDPKWFERANTGKESVTHLIRELADKAKKFDIMVDVANGTGSQN